MEAVVSFSHQLRSDFESDRDSDQSLGTRRPASWTGAAWNERVNTASVIEPGNENVSDSFR